jgi:DNA-binding MarR family transcriptional regulator
VSQGRFIEAGTGREFAPEPVVGEETDSALGVMDDGDLERGAAVTGAHDLADVADERDVSDGRLGDPAAGVTQDDRVTEFDAEDRRRVNPWVQAGDDARHVARDHRRPDTSPRLRESPISFEQWGEVGHGQLPSCGVATALGRTLGAREVRMQHISPAQPMAQAMREGCLGLRVGRLQRLVGRRFDRELRPLGLSMSQLGVLSALTTHGGIVKPARLADWLGTERSTISRNLALLEAKGLVRSAEVSASGRTMAVSLTKRGSDALAGAEGAWRAAQASLTDLLGDDAPAKLDTWLDQLDGT